MNARQKKKQKKIKYMKRWGDVFPNRKEIRHNKWLVKRYPWLMPRNVWTDKMPDDYYYDYVCNDLPCRGWRKKFQTEMFEKIRAELIKFDYLDEFRVLQSKEKWGSLRYYTGGVPKDSKIFDIIHEYEDLSAHTCYSCGGEAEIVGDYWVECICKDCWDKKEKRRCKEFGGESRPYPESEEYDE